MLAGSGVFKPLHLLKTSRLQRMMVIHKVCHTYRDDLETLHKTQIVNIKEEVLERGEDSHSFQ